MECVDTGKAGGEAMDCVACGVGCSGGWGLSRSGLPRIEETDKDGVARWVPCVPAVRSGTVRQIADVGDGETAREGHEGESRDRKSADHE